MARSRRHALRLREAPRFRHAWHGGDEPSARLRRRGGDAGRGRQRGGCRDRLAVRVERGGADDGRPARRRDGASAPAGRHAHRHRRHGDHRRRRAARHVRAGGARQSAQPGSRGARQHGGRAVGRDAGEPEGLVRDARALRHHAAGGCDGAGHQARGTRLPRHALPRRMRRGSRAGHGEGCGDRRAVSARRRAAQARPSRGAGRLCRDAARHRARRCGGARRRAGGCGRGRHRARGRHRLGRGHPRLPHHRARAAARTLSRHGGGAAAAARRIGRACAADAEHPVAPRPARARLRHGGHAAPAGRMPEDRLRRPCRGLRRPGLRRCARRAAHLGRLRRGARGAARHGARPGLGAGHRLGGGCEHDASDGRGFRGAHRLRDADHQLHLRGALPGARHGHDPEQLPRHLRPAPRARAVHRAGQARDDLDVADDRAARRQAGLCACCAAASRPMRWACPGAYASSAASCRRC